MMRIFIGLLLQMTAIYCIGNALFLQELLNSEGIGIIYLSFGIVLWAFSYWMLFDLGKERKK